eukprot:gene694-659_t
MKGRLIFTALSLTVAELASQGKEFQQKYMSELSQALADAATPMLEQQVSALQEAKIKEMNQVRLGTSLLQLARKKISDDAVMERELDELGLSLGDVEWGMPSRFPTMGGGALFLGVLLFLHSSLNEEHPAESTEPIYEEYEEDVPGTEEDVDDQLPDEDEPPVQHPDTFEYDDELTGDDDMNFAILNSPLDFEDEELPTEETVPEYDIGETDEHVPEHEEDGHDEDEGDDEGIDEDDSMLLLQHNQARKKKKKKGLTGKDKIMYDMFFPPHAILTLYDTFRMPDYRGALASIPQNVSSAEAFAQRVEAKMAEKAAKKKKRKGKKGKKGKKKKNKKKKQA